jgi:hypothetical protein
MTSVDHYAERYRQTVQEALPGEQVLAVGILSRPGSMGAAITAQVSDVGFAIGNLFGKRKAPGLPVNVAVAVTPTRLVAFGFTPKMTSIKLKGQVAAWDRRGLSVEVRPGSLATRLILRFADGTVVELDSNRNIGQYQALNDRFLAALGAVGAPTA